jgi:VWFA-related protein
MCQQPRVSIRAKALLGIGFAVCVGAGAAGRQVRPIPSGPEGPQVTFRVDINYVEVAAVVLDKQDQFVAGLGRRDFQVFEDGKLQTITNFGVVEMPIEHAEKALFLPQAIVPDVRANVKPFDGRVYVLVLDDLHTQFPNTGLVRQAAREFVEQSLGDNDIAAVVSTSGHTDASQEFTPNRQLLLAAVERFAGRALGSATLNKIDNPLTDSGFSRGQGRGTPDTRSDTDPEGAERARTARATLSMIRSLSDLMAGIHGRRKALVLFSEGIDYDLNSAIAQGRAVDVNPESVSGVVGSGAARDVQMDARETIAAATRANVAIYGVDASGLTVGGGAADVGLLPIETDPTLNLNLTGIEAERSLQRFSLQTLSEGTGGFSTVSTNNLAAAFDRIQKENSTYYVLGYYPTNAKRDGRFRSIDVRVARPGLRVRARNGYVAPQSKSAAQVAIETQARIPTSLLDVLSNPLQTSGLRLRAFAAPLKGTASNAAVTVVFQAEGRDLRFREHDGIYEAALDVSMVAMSSQGKTKADLFRKVTLPLKPESYQMVERYGLRILSRLDLPPGRYQLRIAAVDVTSQLAGSVHYDLEVPDFERLPLSMSGLVLTSSQAGLVPTAPGPAVDEWRKLLPGPPTVAREFSAGEEIALMAEVYEAKNATPHAVDIATSVRTDEGREVYMHEDRRDSTELAGSAGRFDLTARVPLKGLQPGLYVLKVEAHSRLEQVGAASREVQFRIVP